MSETIEGKSSLRSGIDRVFFVTSRPGQKWMIHAGVEPWIGAKNLQKTGGAKVLSRDIACALTG